MDYKVINHIRCTHCKQRIKIYCLDKQSYGLAKCRCSIYPFAAGILYLKKDQVRIQAADLISKKRYFQALIVLLQLKKSLLFPIVLLTGLQHRINLRDDLRFKIFLQFFTVFGYPKSWVRYLLNRKRMPSFIMSLAAADYFNFTRNTSLIDVGCGTGQFINEITGRILPENIVGLEVSFLSLFLARIFFVFKKTLLICTDIRDGLPFDSKSISICFDVESYQHYPEKQKYLFELGRVITSKGKAAIIHVYNKNRGKDENIFPIPPQETVTHLHHRGFPFVYVLPHKTFWTQLIHNKKIKLTNFLGKPIEQSYAYSFIASRVRMPVETRNKLYSKLKKTRIDYYQDEQL